MDPRDVALQSVAPVIMVPRYSDLEPLSQNGHRFLVADDGLWLEVYRPWLYEGRPGIVRNPRKNCLADCSKTKKSLGRCKGRFSPACPYQLGLRRRRSASCWR